MKLSFNLIIILILIFSIASYLNLGKKVTLEGFKDSGKTGKNEGEGSKKGSVSRFTRGPYQNSSSTSPSLVV